jgi:alkanesulfonate monooxygenase SsuD/methylene tetrahydromethanopterin reductase-like flavin-dependent oxidoreductase (luciferase family)
LIRSWVFEFFPEIADPTCRTPAAVEDYVHAYLDLWTRDEALGYHGIFFSEHHFGGSYSPSPNLLIAALAGRTQRLRLGVMGVVTPYYHPTRIIEEIGLLDHLTRGRLEIGTAIGVPQELARLGLTMEAARGINDESLAILDAALASEDVTHAGAHFRFDALRLVPRPRQQPAPPKWTTVVSPDSARKAARRRSKICTGFAATTKIRELFDVYRDEAARIGFDVDASCLAIRRRVTIAETAGEAERCKAEMAERYRAFVAADPRLTSISKMSAPDTPAADQGIQVSADEFISGTPSDVRAQIEAQCAETGAENFLAVLHWAAGFEEVARAHALYGHEVIPGLGRGC